MWLRSIFLKTLRDCRVPILAWGVGIGVMTPLILVLMPTLLADTEFRAGVIALTRNPAMRPFPEPVDVLSPGGYATWRLSLILPLVSLWALLAVSRTVRGEEESGALDVLLSVPRSRLRVATEKLAAIATALLSIGTVIAVMAFAGGLIANTDLALSAALLYGLNATLLAGVFGSVAMLASQFTRARRTAAGIAGALLGLSVVMTSAGRTVPGGDWIGRPSPLYYFELSKPLVPSYGTNARAMLVLLTLSLVLSVVGVGLFARRDVGAAVVLAVHPGGSAHQARVPPALPLRGWSLQSLVARSIASVAPTAAWWGLALAIYAAMMTVILRQAQENVVELLESFARRGPMYAELIARVMGGGDAAMSARVLTPVFTLLAVAVAGFAVALVSRWTTELEEGRLELLLATPQPRPRVILARFAAIMVALFIVAGLLFASVALTGSIVDFTLDSRRLAQAAFGTMPIGVIVAAIGYLLSGWLRTTAVTGILIAGLLASFAVTLLGPAFRWPPFLTQLSIFEQYGTPLVHGVQVADTVRMLAVSVVVLTVATLRFARKDLAR
jgi:ABC-2 type transport system permease protein